MNKLALFLRNSILFAHVLCRTTTQVLYFLRRLSQPTEDPIKLKLVKCRPHRPFFLPSLFRYPIAQLALEASHITTIYFCNLDIRSRVPLRRLY